MKNKKRRSLRRLITRLIFLLVLLVVLICIYLLTRLNTISNHPLESVKINELNDSNISDYTNIAIFGVDSRENNLEKNTRSDSIIIASIHKKSHEIILTSVYRDTYVQIEGHNMTKINHAYAYGGPDLAVNTLNTNFDLDIKDFVTVNFSALTNMIDSLGGITLDITEEELDWVNAYGKDVAKINGIRYKKIKSAGKQKVTGAQATGYCRVRYTAGGDFTRAKRQRTVIEAIFAKAKKTNPITLLQVMNSLFPQIYTSFTTADILNLAKSFPFYEIAGQKGFPYQMESRRGADGIFYEFPVTLNSNVKKLHRKLFGTKQYEPTRTVTDINTAMGY